MRFRDAGPPFFLRRGGQILIVLAMGAGAGAVANEIGVPMAWMIGPFVCIGAATLAFDLPRLPHFFRHMGQLVAGGAIGLYLTPAATDRIAGHFIEIGLASVGITLAACFIGLAQSRIMRIDLATAMCSAVPGGPVDMALIASQHGGDPMRTAISQVTRIAMVVMAFPLLVTLSASTSIAPPQPTGTWWDTALLVAIGTACGFAGRRLGLISPFFLGPLIVVGGLSAGSVELASHRDGVIPMAQILLGISLGGMFQRSLFNDAGRIVAATFVTTGMLLAICALLAGALSRATGADMPTMFLANAPGAVTEMVVTAKVLQLDVPLVASFQIVRIIVGMMFVWLFLRLARVRR